MDGQFFDSSNNSEKVVGKRRSRAECLVDIDASTHASPNLKFLGLEKRTETFPKRQKLSAMAEGPEKTQTMLPIGDFWEDEEKKEHATCHGVI